MNQIAVVLSLEPVAFSSLHTVHFFEAILKLDGPEVKTAANWVFLGLVDVYSESIALHRRIDLYVSLLVGSIPGELTSFEKSAIHVLDPGTTLIW